MKVIRVEDAVAGRFYDSEKWGRILCCGTSDKDKWIPAFAVRVETGQTTMKYLHAYNISEAETQSWNDAINQEGEAE